MSRLLAAAVVAALLGLTGCGSEAPGEETVSVEPPKVGDCRVLEPADIAAATNDTEPVPCTEGHTAETFAVGKFTGELAEAAYDDESLGAAVYRDCAGRFQKFTGADESLVLRSVLSWAWFRPSEDAWDEGARWYRCDVVGGTEESPELVALPKTAKGLLLGIPADRWMACVDAESVDGAVHVPCSEEHTWRAVSTIVVGKKQDKYPGDRLVEVRSRDFCSDWVGAWMNYPVDYEYAWTWFGETEWRAGNRRSICWARTSE